MLFDKRFSLECPFKNFQPEVHSLQKEEIFIFYVLWCSSLCTDQHVIKVEEEESSRSSMQDLEEEEEEADHTLYTQYLG
jgi:hypothetical protein